MLSVDNFYKVVNIQVIIQRKSQNLPSRYCKYRVYLNKDVCHSILYTSLGYLNLYYNIISGYVELCIPLKVAVGDYLCIVDNIPSEEDIGNLLSEINDPELIKTLIELL